MSGGVQSRRISVESKFSFTLYYEAPPQYTLRNIAPQTMSRGNVFGQQNSGTVILIKEGHKS